MATSFSLQVRCRPDSLRAVRDAVDTLDTLDQRTFDAVKLVTNELVGNSVGHSGLGEDDYIEITVARQWVHPARRSVAAIWRTRFRDGSGAEHGRRYQP